MNRKLKPFLIWNAEENAISRRGFHLLF